LSQLVKLLIVGSLQLGLVPEFPLDLPGLLVERSVDTERRSDPTLEIAVLNVNSPITAPVYRDNIQQGFALPAFTPLLI